MEEKNEPVLFVNSCSVYRSSEKLKNKNKLHRLDDVKVLLKLKKIVEVELILDTMSLTGEVKEINNNEIIIKLNDKDTIINLQNVKTMKIITTK